MAEIEEIAAQKRLFQSINEYYFINYFKVFQTDLIIQDRIAQSLNYDEPAVIEHFVNKTKLLFQNDDAVDFVITYFNNAAFSRGDKAFADFFAEYTRYDQIDDVVDVLLSKDDAAQLFLQVVREVCEYWIVDYTNEVTSAFYMMLKTIAFNDALAANAPSQTLMQPEWRSYLESDKAFLVKFLHYYKRYPAARLMLQNIVDEVFPTFEKQVVLIQYDAYIALAMLATDVRSAVYDTRDRKKLTTLTVTPELLGYVLALGYNEAIGTFSVYNRLYDLVGITFFANVLAIADMNILEMCFGNNMIQRSGKYLVSQRDFAALFDEISRLFTLHLKEYHLIDDLREMYDAIMMIKDEEVQSVVWTYFLQDPRLNINGNNFILIQWLIRDNNKEMLEELVQIDRKVSFFTEDLEYKPHRLNVRGALYKIAWISPAAFEILVEALDEVGKVRTDDLLFIKSKIEADRNFDTADMEAIFEIIDRTLDI